MKKEVRILAKKPAYEGYFRIDKVNFQHTLFAGGWSDPCERELFDRGQVAAVLTYDPAMDAILLIEQCRVGAIESEYSPWLLEIVAGIIEPGEKPEDVVRRESIEEAGCEIENVRKIATFFVSPGGTSEVAHVFFSEGNFSTVGGLHGLEEEGEDIAVHVLAREEVFAMLDAGVFLNSKTIVALQWFALNFSKKYGIG